MCSCHRQRRLRPIPADFALQSPSALQCLLDAHVVLIEVVFDAVRGVNLAQHGHRVLAAVFALSVAQRAVLLVFASVTE
ncbi:hypothetical protein NFJ02_07g131690 [Pycnococcus provasolii]